MNINFYKYFVFFISLSLIARPPLADLNSHNVKLLKTRKMRFSYISFVEIDGKKFLVKQKRFLYKILGVVRDAITAHIAESLDLAHKVDIIPAGQQFPGKIRLKWPATLHTIAPGKLIIRESSPYKRMNIKQADSGFKRDMLRWMAKHSLLIKIVALDTFICNHDRHSRNIFYNKKDDSFCAIDMDSSFKYNLCALACKNFTRMLKTNLFPLKRGELNALREYKRILTFLINTYKPKYTIKMYNDFLDKTGIVEDSSLYTEKIYNQLEHNRNMIRQGYKDSKKLINILKKVIKKACRYHRCSRSI